MSYRRLAASAAVLAAGISFLPGTAAQATGPATDGGAKGLTTPDLVPADAVEKTRFSSPAAESTRETAPTAKTGLSAPQPTAPGAGAMTAETGAADFQVGVDAYTTSAHGLALDTWVQNLATSASVTVAWGDGATTNAAYDGSGQPVASEHTYAELGTYTVKVTVTDSATATAVTNEVQVTTEGSDYTPYGPTRLLDTRNGTGAAKTKVAPYTSAKVKIAGNGGIPAGVTAVVLNVTVTNTTSGGHVTAFADGDDRPTTSNVNFAPGQTVPNLVIVPVGANGYVNLYNGGWESVDLIADVTGYFTQSASSGYTPLAPERFVDTRNGTGTAKGQVAGYGSFSVQIAGQGKVPASGVKAVALNVTVTNPKSDGHLTVYPSGQSAPTASNVNFTAGQTIANSVIVPVGPDGRIVVRNGGWNPADVIVDVVGYYSPASAGAYLPFQPERLLDTRDNATWGEGPLGGRGYVYLPLAAGEPGITGFVLNSTVTNTKDNGYLAVSPDPNTIDAYIDDTATWPAAPTSSTLNWTVGKTVPNLVQASTGANGIVDFWNQSDGNVDLIVDVFGLYQDN
ncbi:PKD domain-containing protein [Streptomyces sp. NPDC004050]